MIASWLVDQLVQQGVADFCTAPGSRSTPLVLAAINHPKAKVHVHFDERGTGFFALGIAKGKNKPVAVIVTSGTAVGNLLPSVMEAHHTDTPLILITADRPHELRDCSANQTSDQVKIFQPFVRWQTDLHTELNENTIRSIAAQGYGYTESGPIHINCPFKEPLHHETVAQEGKPFAFTFPRLAIDQYKTTKTKGVILVGKLPRREDIHPILALAKRLQWPLLADILSNARCHPTPEQIRFFDWNEKPKPEFVLHFGDRFTSKKILDWLKSIKSEYVHVSPKMQLQDPERILTGRVQADALEFCSVFEGGFDPSWLESWTDIEPEFEEKGFFTEVHAMRQIAQIIPKDFGVYLGSGMPIRDADHFFFPKECRGFFANRGLSGIDGNIATIAGLAETMPILGIIGDQAALYDLNSLPLLKKTKYSVLLVISNNFGGGIFHHLPIANSPHFEQFWAFGHDLHFQKAAEMFAIPFFSFEKLKDYLNKTAIFELITDRKENYLYQKSQVKNTLSLNLF